MTVGLLHPGMMGSAVGERCIGRVVWASEGRSELSMDRAVAAGLEDVGTVEALVSVADTIVSICPPGRALEVAQQVAGLGFDGTYVDANAIAPATARTIGEHFQHFVDGGLIGAPPRDDYAVRLYLAGDRAQVVEDLFAGSTVTTRVLAGPAGSASAIKVCFAAWTKGTSAMLFAIRALATAEGVDDALVTEWQQSIPDLVGRAEASAPSVAPKAWRWVDEMNEIAQSFADHGLPAGFHEGSAQLYEQLAIFKDQEPSFEQVLDALS